MGIVYSAGIPNFRWNSSKIHCLLVGKIGIDCKLYLIFNFKCFCKFIFVQITDFSIAFHFFLQEFKKKVVEEVAKLWTAEAFISREVQGAESENFKKLFKNCSKTIFFSSLYNDLCAFQYILLLIITRNILFLLFLRFFQFIENIHYFIYLMNTCLYPEIVLQIQGNFSKSYIEKKLIKIQQIHNLQYILSRCLKKVIIK